MVTQIPNASTTEVIYPESDGQPMANNTEQFRWIVVIEQNLEYLYADNPNVFIAGDLFWYPLEGRNDIVYAPDVMVAIGRPKGKRGSYQQWDEDNIPPQVVFEILSPSNTQDEMDKKLLFYDRYGVEEYYIYNPKNNQLRGFVRGNFGLDVINSMANWISPRLGIRFDISGQELEIYHPDGIKFFSYTEANQQLEEANQQLEEANQQLEEANQQLEEANQRVEEANQIAQQQRQRAEEVTQQLEAANQIAQQEMRKSQLLQERLQQMGINFEDLS
jgi:Uma2 family endonuclease/exonuclease VII small subunit